MQKRFGNNINAFRGGWIEEWTPGQPFRNFFMLRNPVVENRGFFTYATGDRVGEETGYNPEFDNYLATTLRPMFLGEALVRKHVEDPEAKLAALLALNDGAARCWPKSSRRSATRT